MGVGRLRHVPIAGRGQAGALVAPRQGHAKEKHHDLDYLVDQLDWEANVNRASRTATTWSRLPRAIRPRRARRPLDRLRQGGRKELFSAKELTVNPGVKVTVKDNGAYGLINRSGHRPARPLRAADAGDDPLRRADRGRGLRHSRRGATRVVFENTGSEPLVTLRYFGPDTNRTRPPSATTKAITLRYRINHLMRTS